MEKSILCGHGPPVRPNVSSIHLCLDCGLGRMDTKTKLYLRPTLWPTADIIRYLKLRGPSADPLFVNLDGSPLTRQALSTTIQSILQAAGVQGQCSGHSFWIEAATTAAGQGVQDHLIKTFECFREARVIR